MADLCSQALRSRDRAYAPYSHFRVGAAVLTADGSIFAGCNVENASYGLSICAERVAVFQAVAAGHTSITAIAVATDLVPPAAPCGACRQVLREFGPDARIIAVSADGDHWEAGLDELLPRSFGPNDLTRGAYTA